jgi:hypothetical protein
LKGYSRAMSPAMAAIADARRVHSRAPDRGKRTCQIV